MSEAAGSTNIPFIPVGATLWAGPADRERHDTEAADRRTNARRDDDNWEPAPLVPLRSSLWVTAPTTPEDPIVLPGDVPHAAPPVATAAFAPSEPLADSASELARVVHSVPVINPIPVINPMPVVNAIPVINPMPVVNAIPVIDPTPAVSTIPVIDRIPVVNRIPMVNPLPAFSRRDESPGDQAASHNDEISRNEETTKAERLDPDGNLEDHEWSTHIVIGSTVGSVLAAGGAPAQTAPRSGNGAEHRELIGLFDLPTAEELLQPVDDSGRRLPIGRRELGHHTPALFNLPGLDQVTTPGAADIEGPSVQTGAPSDVAELVDISIHDEIDPSDVVDLVDTSDPAEFSGLVEAEDRAEEATALEAQAQEPEPPAARPAEADATGGIVLVEFGALQAVVPSDILEDSDSDPSEAIPAAEAISIHDSVDTVSPVDTDDDTDNDTDPDSADALVTSGSSDMAGTVVATDVASDEHEDDTPKSEVVFDVGSLLALAAAVSASTTHAGPSENMPVSGMASAPEPDCTAALKSAFEALDALDVSRSTDLVTSLEAAAEAIGRDVSVSSPIVAPKALHRRPRSARHNQRETSASDPEAPNGSKHERHSGRVTDRHAAQIEAGHRRGHGRAKRDDEGSELTPRRLSSTASGAVAASILGVLAAALIMGGNSKAGSWGTALPNTQQAAAGAAGAASGEHALRIAEMAARLGLPPTAALSPTPPNGSGTGSSHGGTSSSNSGVHGTAPNGGGGSNHPTNGTLLASGATHSTSGSSTTTTTRPPTKTPSNPTSILQLPGGITGSPTPKPPGVTIPPTPKPPGVTIPPTPKPPSVTIPPTPKPPSVTIPTLPSAPPPPKPPVTLPPPPPIPMLPSVTLPAAPPPPPPPPAPKLPVPVPSLPTVSVPTVTVPPPPPLPSAPTPIRTGTGLVSVPLV